MASDDKDERSAFVHEAGNTGAFSRSRKPGDDKAAQASSPQAPSPHAGHRDRLRQRFARAGDQALADYELLELILYRSIPRRDTKPVAKALIAAFGSFGAVLGSDAKRLADVPGMGEASALDLKIVAAAGRRLAREAIEETPVLTSWSAVIDYCTAAMAYEAREQFRILFLDKKNRLIADEVQQTGTVDHAPVYPREVLRRSVELHATAIILVHNHPSGDPTPSRADIEMTRRVIEVLTPVNIIVHDHIIIGKSGHASLKGLALI